MIEYTKQHGFADVGALLDRRPKETEARWLARIGFAPQAARAGKEVLVHAGAEGCEYCGLAVVDGVNVLVQTAADLANLRCVVVSLPGPKAVAVRQMASRGGGRRS